MARRGRTKECTDGYGHLINTSDTVVFSWSGDLYKGKVLSTRPVKYSPKLSTASRQELEIIPLDADGTEIDHVVTVKDARSTVKV